ncbi:hypothetical protein ACHOLT_00375 [Desulfitobacterium sp. Sab5]
MKDVLTCPEAAENKIKHYAREGKFTEGCGDPAGIGLSLGRYIEIGV